MGTNTPNTDASLHAALPNPPIWARGALALVSGVVGLSTLPWIWMSISKFGGFDWGLFGFELFTLMGAIYGLLIARGLGRQAWGLAVACIVGAWLVALVFGLFVGFYKAKLSDFPDLYTLARATLLTRAAIIAAGAGLATLVVFTRDTRSFKYLFGSLVWASPIVILAALVRLDTAPGGWYMGLITGGDGSGTGGGAAVVLLLSGVIFITLVSISGHMLIRAYEMGRLERVSENQGS